MIKVTYPTTGPCACGTVGHGSPVYIEGAWVRMCLAHLREHFSASDHADYCDGRVVPIYSGAKRSDCACRRSEVWSASA